MCACALHMHTHPAHMGNVHTCALPPCAAHPSALRTHAHREHMRSTHTCARTARSSHTCPPARTRARTHARTTARLPARTQSHVRTRAHAHTEMVAVSVLEVAQLASRAATSRGEAVPSMLPIMQGTAVDPPTQGEVTEIDKVYTDACTCAGIHTCTNVCIHTYMCTCIHAYMPHMHTQVLAYMDACVKV